MNIERKFACRTLTQQSLLSWAFLQFNQCLLGKLVDRMIIRLGKIVFRRKSMVNGMALLAKHSETYFVAEILVIL